MELIAFDNGVKLKFPEDLSEVTLRQYREFTELGEQVIEKKADLESLILEIELGEADQDDFDLAELEMNLVYMNQLKSILPESEKDKLEKINPVNYPILLEIIQLKEFSTEPILSFKFPEGIFKDVQRLQEEIEEAKEKGKTRKEIKFLRNRLRALEKNPYFRISPLDQLPFGGRIGTDSARGKLPKIPQDLKKEINEYTEDEKKRTLKDFAQYVNRTDFTLEQKREVVKQRRLLNSYAANFETIKYKVAHKIISHISIPFGFEYSYNLAEERADLFLDLPMNIVNNLLETFIEALKIWTLNSLIYGKAQEIR